MKKEKNLWNFLHNPEIPPKKLFQDQRKFHTFDYNFENRFWAEYSPLAEVLGRAGGAVGGVQRRGEWWRPGQGQQQHVWAEGAQDHRPPRHHVQTAVRSNSFYIIIDQKLEYSRNRVFNFFGRVHERTQANILQILQGLYKYKGALKKR